MRATPNKQGYQLSESWQLHEKAFVMAEQDNI
jgi:hypothetical protein